MDTRQGGETDTYFHGTVGQGATAGATLLPVTFTSGQDATTDGAFLLDISKGTIHGTVSGLDAIVDKTSVHILPVTLAAGHLSPSTGIGIIQTPIPIISIPNVPESVTLDVALAHGTFKPGIACLAGGWYPEQVTVTAVSEATGATQKVTLIHKTRIRQFQRIPTIHRRSGRGDRAAAISVWIEIWREMDFVRVTR